MRVATWNVNSIRSRVDRVTDWLVREDIDVLAMQEIKCRPDQFPHMSFTAAGYEVELNGFNQWNGVAFASRLPMEEVELGFPGVPGFGTALPDGTLPTEARAMGVTVEGVRLWSVYVPNGRELGHPHYSYKLEWLERLTEATKTWLAEHPGRPFAVMGDFNIAPLDTDVWDIAAFDGATHVSKPERQAFEALLGAGLVDVVRDRAPGYTYWDYKAGRWNKNEGMRIDFVLGTPELAELVTRASIDRDQRQGDAPSDHVPVIVDLDLETVLDDDRPMIF
jgi:exodeoxyribonuclease-3